MVPGMYVDHGQVSVTDGQRRRIGSVGRLHKTRGSEQLPLVQIAQIFRCDFSLYIAISGQV